MKWYVEWKISGIQNKASFTDYKYALDYMQRTLKLYGKEYKLEISMWKGE